MVLQLHTNCWSVKCMLFTIGASGMQIGSECQVAGTHCQRIVLALPVTYFQNVRNIFIIYQWVQCSHNKCMYAQSRHTYTSRISGLLSFHSCRREGKLIYLNVGGIYRKKHPIGFVYIPIPDCHDWHGKVTLLLIRFPKGIFLKILI